MVTNGEITKGISTLYDTINQIIEEARAAVYRTANITMVRAYWHIGRVIVEDEQKGKERAEYGKQVLKQLSQKLTKKHGRGFDESNLRHMRNFYLVYPKCDALRPELSWTHYRLLLKVGNEQARLFYMQETRENELEQAIIDKLQNFLQELGKGFAFVGRQYRLTTDTGKHFYADLVFYNYILKFFLIIDLKAEPLTHQDIGQMDMYVRYFEEKMRQETDNPTIGLILCTEKDKTIVKYSLLNDSNQIFASKYMLYLPTEQELKKEIERQRVQIEQERKLNQ